MINMHQLAYVKNGSVSTKLKNCIVLGSNGTYFTDENSIHVR